MTNYAVVIHHEPEGGGYWAEVPALPGCYSQGETVDELLHNVREAITVNPATEDVVYILRRRNG